jgi:hypothetical protein
MFESLVSLLPASAQPYAKTIVAAILSALGVLSSTLDEVPGWVPIVVALLSAPAIFAFPNLDPKAEKQAESVQPPAAPLGAGVGAVAIDATAAVSDVAGTVYASDTKTDAALNPNGE